MIELKKRAIGHKSQKEGNREKMRAARRDRKPGFDSEFTGTVLRIKLRGEIDHHSAAAVRTAIDDMIRSKRPSELIIDMSAVDFMDSSGLGLIMGRYNTIKEIGGSVTVADPTPATEKIMRLAGLERIIKIVKTSITSAKKEPELDVRAIMSVGMSEKSHKPTSQKKAVHKGKEEV